MPRPKRPGWSRITITVSDEISRHIRIRAAELGIEMGTFVNEAIAASLRSPQPPRPAAPPVPEVEPAFREHPALPRAAPANAPTGQAVPPAGSAGTHFARLADFAHQKAIANPESRLFSPLRHLQVADRLTATALSAAMFRTLIASACSSAGFELAGATDPGTLRFLDAVLQTLDRFFLQLHTAFPLDESRVALWTPGSASAFGTLFGRRLGRTMDGADLEGSAQRVSEAVAGMVKNLARVNANAPELLAREVPERLVSLLTLHEIPLKKRDSRGPDGDASDSGYGYFT